MQEKDNLCITNGYSMQDAYVDKTYLFIKGYATGRKFTNTLKALPLAKIAHEGQYRAGLVDVNGHMIQLPYVLHVLKVCSTLMALDFPMSDEELDTLYAVALLHDALEDGSEHFPKGGIEFEQDHGMPEQIRKIVQMLSKHSGAKQHELDEYFNRIKRDKHALLIKLADRSHNVEDLYNIKNVPKYIKETRDYFLNSKDSISTYGKQHYPELSNGITILKAKILSLTEATEAMMIKYENELKEKDRLIEQLNQQLRREKKNDRVAD